MSFDDAKEKINELLMDLFYEQNVDVYINGKLVSTWEISRHCECCKGQNICIDFE